MTQQPQVLFVRGCARSGTTLLADVLNESPGVGILVEQPLGDIARRLAGILWFEDHVLQQRAALRPVKTDAAYFAPHDNTPRLTHPRRYPTRERLPAMVAAVVEAALEKTALRVIGSKTPGHWSYADLDLLKALFERVRSVFLVRNPLETINSIVNRRNAGRAGVDSWPDKPVDEAIRSYQEAACLLLSCASDDAGRTFVIGYEDLIGDPSAVLGALGEFLGVDVHDRTGLIAGSAASKKVLAPREEAAVRDAFGAAIAAWNGKRLTGPASQLAGQIDDCVRIVSAGAEYRFDAPVGDRGLLGSGWAGAEPRGISSDAPHADIFFAVPRDGLYLPSVTLSSSKGDTTLSIAVAEHNFGHRLRRNRSEHLRCGPVTLASGRAHRLRFTFAEPSHGICLRRFRVRAV